MRGVAQDLRIREHRRVEHPIMFDADDPWLARVREVALAYLGGKGWLDASWRHSAPKRLLG
ncbi:hypothetical protein CLV52_1321 [Amnibacterium kyonggiense]|uniref:Uncharacterized protein n=1 Tax=Amnibacterium kyonggiense TaxID=595671 RepID=A0A4R7FSB7_9MICO|nr:hypothetical protein CLV52_1321 [Amnibacterium kyonggiense]